MTGYPPRKPMSEAEAQTIVEEADRIYGPDSGSWPQVIYASKRHPMSGSSASISCARYITASTLPLAISHGVLTWVIVPQPLDLRDIESYQLELVYQEPVTKRYHANIIVHLVVSDTFEGDLPYIDTIVHDLLSGQDLIERYDFTIDDVVTEDLEEEE